MPRDEGVSERYRQSERMLERALRTIPLGSQTFSKSKTQYPFGVSPYFIKRGRGSRVWDVDGNEYVDFVGSLAAITLGYSDPDVDAAVREQLEDGVIFSLPHPIEIEVAEAIVDCVPCAEMVRFGKNGSDATAGAVRLARAYTARDRLAVCGYHGWQDWYIGSTARWLGVPKTTRELTHTFTYNDLDSLTALLDRHPNEFAAVVLEPMNVTSPAAGFLEGIRDITRERGIVLVFDEMITGFRYGLGGAQERFGVTPDVATFGKGLANGYPLSAVAGSAAIMRMMEEIFFSFTFGGETLSLAAARATIAKLRREPVLGTIRSRGEALLSGLEQVIDAAQANEVLRLSGDPSWSFLNINPDAGESPLVMKTFLMQEFLKRGILWLGTHNLHYAHSSDDIDRLIGAYAEVVPPMMSALRSGGLRGKLECESLEPLFRVR